METTFKNVFFKKKKRMIADFTFDGFSFAAQKLWHIVEEVHGEQIALMCLQVIS